MFPSRPLLNTSPQQLPGLRADIVCHWSLLHVETTEGNEGNEDETGR